ncbi:MAG TPA: 2TM domain-containing protein [Flavobacterium sp.]|jgi:hypothetical protein|nr:2TM domain-containing protein [Flavobacterium sp.]
MENSNNIEQQRFERAQKRVKAIAGFYKHLISYLLVNCFLVALKYYSLDANESLFTFGTFSTAFFWGIGLVFHGVSVFGANVFLGQDWEERKIRELMDKQKQQKWE